MELNIHTDVWPTWSWKHDAAIVGTKEHTLSLCYLNIDWALIPLFSICTFSSSIQFPENASSSSSSRYQSRHMGIIWSGRWRLCEIFCVSSSFWLITGDSSVLPVEIQSTFDLAGSWFLLSQIKLPHTKQRETVCHLELLSLRSILIEISLTASCSRQEAALRPETAVAAGFQHKGKHLSVSSLKTKPTVTHDFSPDSWQLSV